VIVAASSAPESRKKLGNERLTELCVAAATVLDQKDNQGAEPRQTCAVDNRAAIALRRDQTRTEQDGEIHRHRALGNSEVSGDLPRRKAVRLVFHQKSERLQADRLGQASQSSNACIRLHSSEVIETRILVNS
jgi:hypothetical protein